MTYPASFACALRGDAGKLGDVGAGREERRLAGDHRRRVVAALEIPEHAVEGTQRRLAEEGRLRLVLAVVDLDERDVVHALEPELRIGHADEFMPLGVGAL